GLAETRDHLLEEMGRAPVGHHLGGQARSTPPPAPHGVVREYDLPLAAEADEPDQRAQPGTVRMQQLEPEAVEADVPPAVEHREVVVEVARPAAVADDDRR